MINKDNVNAVLISLGAFSEEEAQQWSALVDAACRSVEATLKSEEYESDSRAENLAACRAFYKTALAKSASLNVVSFTAGDVKITNSADLARFAKSLAEQAEAECKDICSDEAFAFIGV